MRGRRADDPGDRRGAGRAPSVVWVGEPTLWGVCPRTRAFATTRSTSPGKAAHSSDPRLGAPPFTRRSIFSSVLRRIAREQEANAPEASDFDPSWTTITVGEIGGGTAANILARECRFVFDVRTVPGGDPDAMLAPFFAEVERVARQACRRSGLNAACGWTCAPTPRRCAWTARAPRNGSSAR